MMPTQTMAGIGEPLGPVLRFQPYFPARLVRFSDNHPTSSTNYILDPIGGSPQLLADLVKAGHRVIATVSNPVDRLLLQYTLSSPPPDVVRSVMAELSQLRIEGVRLEKHLQAMMSTTCGKCGQQVPVDRYIWNDDTKTLIEKVFNCPCGYGGEFGVDEKDLALADKWARSDGLYRSAILSLFKPIDGVDSNDLVEYLKIYSPRSLHGIDLLVNRIREGFDSDEKNACARLLVLFVADRCSGMWNPAESMYRPKMVQCPPKRIETNIWNALTDAYIALLEPRDKGVVYQYPDLPEGAGLVLYPGSYKKWLATNPKLPIMDVITVLPRPSQAYWILSAIWARWILDTDEKEEYLAILRRKRFDWAWYGEVLGTLMARIIKNCPSNAPLTLFIPDAESDFLLVVAYALARAGFHWFSFTPRSGSELTMVEVNREKTASSHQIGSTKLVKDWLQDILLDSFSTGSEPKTYFLILADVLQVIGTTSPQFLTEYSADQLEKDLQLVLEGPLFEDIANRLSVKTGIWKRKGSESQASLGF